MVSNNTNNLSFRNMQYKLQDIDCENFYFMNRLDDKELDGIDIYVELENFRLDKSKRSDFIQKVIKECKNNIWYFFREVVRIPTNFNIQCNVDTNLAMFPLDYKSAIMIYFYEKGLSFINCDTKISTYDMTMAFIIIYESFIKHNDGDNLTPCVIENLSNAAENNKWVYPFRQLYQYCIWSINNILGLVDGITTSYEKTDNWNYDAFNFKKLSDKFNCGDYDLIHDHNDGLFFPTINDTYCIYEFLEYAKIKNNKRCYASIKCNEECNGSYSDTNSEYSNMLIMLLKYISKYPFTNETLSVDESFINVSDVTSGSQKLKCLSKLADDKVNLNEGVLYIL